MAVLVVLLASSEGIVAAFTGFEFWYVINDRVGPDTEKQDSIRLKVSFVGAVMRTVRTFDSQHVGRMQHVQACAARVLDSIDFLSIAFFPQGFVHVVLGCSVRVNPIRIVELFNQLGRAEEGMPAPIARVVGARANVVASDGRVVVSDGFVRGREIVQHVSDADGFLQFTV